MAGVGRLPQTDRPLIAIDPDGDDLRQAELPAGVILAFGTERHGLTADCSSAPTPGWDPDATGVSSLNLATAVAAVAVCPAPLSGLVFAHRST